MNSSNQVLRFSSNKIYEKMVLKFLKNKHIYFSEVWNSLRPAGSS